MNIFASAAFLLVEVVPQSFRSPRPPSQSTVERRILAAHGDFLIHEYRAMQREASDPFLSNRLALALDETARVSSVLKKSPSAVLTAIKREDSRCDDAVHFFARWLGASIV